MDVLGEGTVSPNLIDGHRGLLSRAGDFPIVSAHIHFANGEGLDPRFQYATIIREPVDRTISWLFFVTRNHDREQFPELYDDCKAVLDSDGEKIGSCVAPAIVNPMVGHYARILGSCGLGGEELTETAFRAIEAYDCVGTFERLGDFVAGLGELVGIPAPAALQPVNVTVARPAWDGITSKLRDNLMAVTALDRQLYERVAKLVDERLAARPPKPPKKSKWARYDRQSMVAQTTSSLTLDHARLLHAEPTHAGAVLRFELAFELHEPVQVLQAGFHIFDDRKRWVFGINNALLNQPFADLGPGRYRMVHFVTAELMAGEYTIGFAFADVGGSTERSLYWHDELLTFSVCRNAQAIGVGNASCIARMLLEPAGIVPNGNRNQANSTPGQQLAA